MKKYYHHVGLSVITALLVLVSGCDTLTQTKHKEKKAENPTPIEGQYIVVLQDDNNYTQPAPKINLEERVATDNGINRTAVVESSNDLMSAAEINPEESVLSYYSHAIQGFSVKATKEQIEVLKNDPRVSYVEADKKVSLPPIKVHDGPTPAGLETQAESSKKQGDEYHVNADFNPWGVSRVGGVCRWNRQVRLDYRYRY